MSLLVSCPFCLPGENNKCQKVKTPARLLFFYFLFFLLAKQQFQVPDYIRAKAQGFEEEEQIRSYAFLAEFPSEIW